MGLALLVMWWGRATGGVSPKVLCECVFHLDRSVRQMYTATRVTMLALGLVAAGAAAVQAQNNATINVTAAVQQPIVVTAANALDFGQVFPGVPKGVALASASAGRFTVTGQGGAGVSLAFVVPAKDRKSTRLNSSHVRISYAVFCLKKKKNQIYELSERVIQTRTRRDG